jgi:hypothetical protein
VASAALCLVGVTAFLAGYLQPRMLDYQPTKELTALARRLEPDAKELLFTLGPSSFSATFYARRDVPYLAPKDLPGLIVPGTRRLVLLGPDGGPEYLHEVGLSTEELAALPSFPTSRPSGRFLSASTRASVVRTMRLVWAWHANAPPPTSSPPASDAPR